MKAWLVGLVLAGSVWTAAANAQDYRAEITRKVIDPCMTEVAISQGWDDIGLEEAVDMMKSVLYLDLAQIVELVHEELIAERLHTKSYRTRLAFYETKKVACVWAYTTAAEMQKN